MNWSRIRAVIRKDLKEVAGMKMVVLPMIVVPLLLCIIMPAAISITVFTYGIKFISNAEMMEQIIPLYAIPEVFSTVPLQIQYIFLNYTFLPLFMVIPVMISSIITANSIVGEKERNTLETLLYTPITQREFITSKLLGAFIPGFLLTVVGFLCYFAVVNGISFYYVGEFMVRSSMWLVGIFLTAPALSLLGLTVTLLVSLRAKTYLEAQQMSALVVVPLVLLIVMQITGVITFHTGYALLFSVAVLLLDWFAMSRLLPRFKRENIL